ncbi:MAG: glycosyltransferase, partial [Lachnospiraceae bacterium]|nr:glycosyltransferase [Lachnospiraceae bacterium]
MAKVSIIVPVYNSEKYLEKCLESLAGQTLKELEVVLVNDGSTDSSLEIMESFSKKYSGRFVIINKENGGQASARNMGIKQSSGEYIGFVDSDDRVDIHMFEEMYNHAVVKNYDLVECHYHYVQELEDGTIKELATRGDIRQHENRRDMFINPMASPWNKLYKRSVLIDGNITFPEGLIYEDTSFFIKSIPFIRSSYYMEDKFVYYYLRGNSTMNANKSRRVGCLLSPSAAAADLRGGARGGRRL